MIVSLARSLASSPRPQSRPLASLEHPPPQIRAGVRVPPLRSSTHPARALALRLGSRGVPLPQPGLAPWLPTRVAPLWGPQLPKSPPARARLS